MNVYTIRQWTQTPKHLPYNSHRPEGTKRLSSFGSVGYFWGGVVASGTILELTADVYVVMHAGGHR